MCFSSFAFVFAPSWRLLLIIFHGGALFGLHFSTRRQIWALPVLPRSSQVILFQNPTLYSLKSGRPVTIVKFFRIFKHESLYNSCRVSGYRRRQPMAKHSKQITYSPLVISANTIYFLFYTRTAQPISIREPRKGSGRHLHRRLYSAVVAECRSVERLLCSDALP